MLDNVCRCLYEVHINKPVNTWSIVGGFLLTLMIIIVGLIINLRVRKKLQEEKRNTLQDRKGNVIEPIMRWYLILAMVQWPYEMSFMWMMANEILPAAWFGNCWFANILMNPMRIGRSILAFNSLFVALIRYVYIVHLKKANEWTFEKVGKIFQIASIAVPVCMEVIRILSEEDMVGLKATDEFLNCVAKNENLNTTLDLILPKPAPVAFTMGVLSPELVRAVYYIYLTVVTLVYLNLIEAYLYFKIFQTIKRYRTTFQCKKKLYII